MAKATFDDLLTRWTVQFENLQGLHGKEAAAVAAKWRKANPTRGPGALEPFVQAELEKRKSARDKAARDKAHKKGPSGGPKTGRHVSTTSALVRTGDVMSLAAVLYASTTIFLKKSCHFLRIFPLVV